MNLMDVLSGGQIKNTGTQVSGTQSAQNCAAASNISRQIQALTPGQTLQGEVVSRDGNQVQIKVADDMVLEARLDQDMNLEVGKNMTFEVRNNGQTLTLSPLFANTANQQNVLKAVEMAALPVNQSTVSMTGTMMEAGLSIDRTSLQQVFREVNIFPESDVSDVVDLHKMGLEVNEENLTQIASYKNLTHQLVEGMHTVTDSIPNMVESMVYNGQAKQAAEMFQDMLDLLQELPKETVEAAIISTDVSGQLPTKEQAALSQMLSSDEELQKMLNGLTDAPAESLRQMPGQEQAQTENLQSENLQSENLQSDNPQADNPQLNDVQLVSGELDSLYSIAEQNPKLQILVQQFADAIQNGSTPEQAQALQQLLKQGIQDENQPLLENLLTDKSVQKILSEGLSKLWTIQPQDVADSGKVEELYSRLDRQLKSLTQTLEQNGQTQSETFRAVSNMTQNLDFLQQINQAYTYVQLPLRLQQGDTHGDLYVYTNKRNLAAKDGPISALLHLDMEHLGPVDVYVAMQGEKVNTRFFVQDDEMLDFLEGHMDLLTERLQKRGYNCNFAMQVRQENAEPESGLKGLMAEEPAAQPIAQYSFDVRA